MRILNRHLGALAALSLAITLAAPTVAFAATSPSLGDASTYGVLAGTYVNPIAGTTINGDVGFTTAPAVMPAGTHTNYGSGAPYATAKTNAASALTALNSQSCTFTFPDTAIDLAADTSHGTIGVYTPGVYCTRATRAASIGAAGITLNGAGTYIFRIDGALTTVANSVVTLAGASECDVFWTPTSATTLGATSVFKGTIIDNANAITVGGAANWAGRALTLGAGSVTTGLNSTITAPTSCSTPDTSGSSRWGKISVVKVVVNDNGGTKTVADFPLYVNGLLVASGVSNDFRAPADAYTVTEKSDAGYTQTFSGDCDTDGHLTIVPRDNRFCIITNDDIAAKAVVAPTVVPPVPPLLDIVKVPAPLALPDGPGSVTYTYTLRNIGTVPVTDVTLVGDTCSPIVLTSGDANSDGKLDMSETWVHHCTTTLSETHTNTVVATGWANGISATDIASATVVVGTPAVPPIIHVTKIPSPLALAAGGGNVTFTETVTNPGTVALGSVTLTDDKCSPMKYVSGDANGDSKLDVTESWVYTCTARLSRTTTNTAVASGWANGLFARDLAVATVVVAVAVPVLPKTGVTPLVGTSIAWLALAVVLLGAVIVGRTARKKHQTS